MQKQNESTAIFAKEVIFIENDLKLTHLRILTVILANLQQALQYKVSRRRPGPLPESFLLMPLSIPLSSFPFLSKNGTRLRTYMDEMMGEHGILPGCSYHFPRYARTVQIYLTQPVRARLLRTEDGYCSVSLDTSLSIANRHTLRLYWLISSWRSRGGFVISQDKLRRLLSLGPSYRRYDNLSGKILSPAAAELKTRGEIWFLWRQRQGSLIFKIQTRPDPERRNAEMAAAWDLCYRTLTAHGVPLRSIQDLYARIPYEDLGPFTSKLVDLSAHVRAHSAPNTPASRTIKDPARYLLKSLDTWLSDWTTRYPDI